MKSITVKIHSLVDVITNSSSVTYVMADEGSIEALKNLINLLLPEGQKADDLFEFSLKKDEELSDKEYNNVCIEVSPKVSDTKVEEAAKILSNLNNLFNYESYYDITKTRILPSNNYKAIFFNGKTLRIAIDFTKPITELSG